jgi:hypothetical protein
MANPTPPSPTFSIGSAAVTPPLPPTLDFIQTKVRRLTRTPSTAQLSDVELNNYINTFVQYDFPEQLRTFNLCRPFSFFTNPYQDQYNTDTLSFAGNTTNPLYNFQNLYLSIKSPVYIAGFQSFFSQSREQFFGIYPIVNNILQTGFMGDGLSTTFTGVVNTQQVPFPTPANFNQKVVLLQNNVLFSSIDSFNQGLALADVPIIDPATGQSTGIGNLYDPNSGAYQLALTVPPTPFDLLPNNNINYVTGVYTITFLAAPGPNIPIFSQTVPQTAALPQALLFYNNQFTVRPVPDQPYRINFEVYQRPAALLATGQSPELEEYAQFIAYGTARKIFQDRMDLESVGLIDPEFNLQMRLCLRRNLVQYATQRTATIYTEQVGQMNGYNGYYGGGQF